VPPSRGGPTEESALVSGLGNPGASYAFSRHNAGFMVVDRLAARCGLVFEKYGRIALVGRGSFGGCRGTLLKPLTFMNRSGLAVGDFMDRFGVAPERNLVVSDEFALPLGTIRFRRSGSAGGHKGLCSIIRTLGTEEFPRLRVGIGPLPEGREAADFVLEPFTRSERVLLDEVLTRAAEAAELWLSTGDIDLCMNRYN
jgi:PTH1 family peptidyl-tRNA hydrolase